MRSSARWSTVTALLVTALLLAPAALAVTTAELQDLESGPAGPETVPQVGSSGLGGAGRVVLGLVAVLGVIMAVHWLLRRAQAGRGVRRGSAEGLDVLSTTSLGPRHQLHLVRVGDDVLLLGAAEQGLRTLHHVRHDAAVAQGLLPPEDTLVADAVFEARTASAGGVPDLDGETAAGLLDALRRRTAR